MREKEGPMLPNEWNAGMKGWEGRGPIQRGEPTAAAAGR